MDNIGLIITIQVILFVAIGFIFFNLVKAISRMTRELCGVKQIQKDIISELRRQRHEYRRPFVLLEHNPEANTVSILNAGSYPAVGLEYEEFTNQLLSFAQKITFLAPGDSIIVNRTVPEPPDAIGICYYGHERNLEYSSKLIGRDLLMKTGYSR